MAIPDSATARSRSVPQITARLPLCRSTRMKKLSRSSGLKRYRALPNSRTRRAVSAPRDAAPCFSRRECLPTGWLCPALVLNQSIHCFFCSCFFSRLRLKRYKMSLLRMPLVMFLMSRFLRRKSFTASSRCSIRSCRRRSRLFWRSCSSRWYSLHKREAPADNGLRS